MGFRGSMRALKLPQYHKNPSSISGDKTHNNIIRGVPWGNFLVAHTTFSLIYMARKGRGRYRKPPLRMRVSVYVGHTDVSSCCILGFIGITLGITLGSHFSSTHMMPVIPGEIGRCNFSLFVIPSVIPRPSEYATKSDCFLGWWRYLFCLLVPGILSMMCSHSPCTYMCHNETQHT